jgi:uncharacterized RDD family membrane protein YckC
MINEYYILREGQKEGPYTHTQLMEMGISATDFLLSPLADGMQQAADLPEFKEHFTSMGIYLPDQRNVATFWWRVLAFLIDYAIVTAGFTLFLSVIEVITVFFHRDIITGFTDFELFSRLIFFLGLVAYNATFEATTMQGGIGKVICKLVVVDGNGQRLSFGKALSRNFAKLLSSLLCGLGFLTVAWNPMKQGWHDQVAKAYVVRKV